MDRYIRLSHMRNRNQALPALTSVLLVWCVFIIAMAVLFALTEARTFAFGFIAGVLFAQVTRTRIQSARQRVTTVHQLSSWIGYDWYVRVGRPLTQGK